MKYDFTTVLDRTGHDCLAADKIPFEGIQPDAGFDTIPMWVADMAFPTAPPILEAIRTRMEMPNFGYFALPEAYYDSIINWHKTRNGVEGLAPKHIGYENGVLGGLSSALQTFTAPGEKILVHSPTYVGFTHTFEDKIRTIKIAQNEGLCVCSGGIIGMGETWDDRIDMALTLAELDIQSIPLNALMPIKGTPLQDTPQISAEDVARTVAIFRFINPTANIRLGAGRGILPKSGETVIGRGASASITGNMLTTAGAATIDSDMQMLKRLGLTNKPEEAQPGSRD